MSNALTVFTRRTRACTVSAMLLLSAPLLFVVGCNGSGSGSQESAEGQSPTEPSEETPPGDGQLEIQVEVRSDDPVEPPPPEPVAPSATLQIAPEFCTLTDGAIIAPSERQLTGMLAAGGAESLYTYYAPTGADEGELRAWSVDTTAGCVLTPLEGFGDDGVASATGSAQTLVRLGDSLGIGASDYVVLDAATGEQTGECDAGNLTRVHAASQAAIALSGDEIQYFDLRPVGCMVRMLFEQSDALGLTFNFGAAGDGVWGVATDLENVRHVVRFAQDGSEMWRWGELEGENSVNALSNFVEVGGIGVVFDGTQVDLMLFDLDSGELLGRADVRSAMPAGFNRAKVLAIVPTSDTTGLLLLQNFVDGTYSANVVPFSVERSPGEPAPEPAQP